MKMVQIQLPEQEKQVVEEERRAGVEAGQVGEDPLLPTTVHHSINKRQRQQATSKRSEFKYSQPSFSSEISLFAEEETFASSMFTSFIEIYENMIVKLRDLGFAFLSVCHLDSEEDLRPQRAGSNIFCCRTIISVIFSFFFSLQPHRQEYFSM